MNLALSGNLTFLSSTYSVNGIGKNILVQLKLFLGLCFKMKKKPSCQKYMYAYWAIIEEESIVWWLSVDGSFRIPTCSKHLTYSLSQFSADHHKKGNFKYQISI